MTTSARLPDAAPANWVDRHAPPGLRPWLKLGRFDRPAGIWLLMLPGWQGIALACAMAGRWPDALLLAKFFVGAALMRAAGCAFNDIVDRDIDAKVARTAARPVASGQISVKQAWAFLIGCSLVSFLILLTLPPLTAALGVGSLGLVAAYPFMKRITWWPQAWLGLTFNWGALLGFAAATGLISTLGSLFLLPALLSGGETVITTEPGLSFGVVTWTVHPAAFGVVSLSALLLYASGVFWTLGYDTIYAIQDLEDDALVGVKSSTRRLGAHVRRGVAVFYGLSLALALAAGLTAGLSVFFLPLFALYAVHLIQQARRVRVDQPAQALFLFKSNAWAGLILFVAIAAGAFGRL